MSALLQVEKLETAYGASQVLFGVDLAIRPGEVATLLGRNGMGKTTTVRSIMGLTPARSGAIRFRGERIERQRPDRIARRGDQRAFVVAARLLPGAIADRDRVAGLFQRAVELLPLLARREDEDFRLGHGAPVDNMMIGEAMW